MKAAPPARPPRIVLAGVESSGKSTLAAWLARRFHLPYAPEYARTHLEQHGPAYREADLARMALAHLRHQRQHVPDEAPLGIFDTDSLHYQRWSEELYGRCAASILDAVQAENHHLYLLCAPDLPWQPDPLRTLPAARERWNHFERYHQALRATGRPCVILRGQGRQRRIAAIRALRNLRAACSLPALR